VIYKLPHQLQHTSQVELIDDESEEGRRVREWLLSHGMPAGLAELGFRSASDLWRPWCVATVNGEVVSVAFAARISDIATAKAFRGRGYATAAVAGWSRLPPLQSRELFYSTHGSNVSSDAPIRSSCRQTGVANISGDRVIACAVAVADSEDICERFWSLPSKPEEEARRERLFLDDVIQKAHWSVRSRLG
jgi:hypothetical protein